jgi:PAS domain S-box-containing protein
MCPFLRVTLTMGKGTDSATRAESLFRERLKRRPEVDFRLVLTGLPQAVLLLDREGSLLFANRAAGAEFGYPPEELIGKGFVLLFAEKDRKTCSAWLRTIAKNGTALSTDSNRFEALRKDGSTFPVEVLISLPDPTESYFVAAVIENKTDQLRTEEELGASRALFAEAQQIAHLGSWEWDPDSGRIIWSDELYRIYGIEPQSIQLSLRDFLNRVHPEDMDLVEKTIQVALEDHQSFDFDHRIIRTDGSVRVIQARGKTVLGEDGKPVRLVGTGEDITESRQAELALRQKNELVTLVQSVAVAANQATSPETAIKTCLDQICAYTGWPVGHVCQRDEQNPDEMISMGIWHLDEEELFENFREITEMTRFARGKGLPGRVWASVGPIWAKDVNTDPAFPRIRLVRGVEIRSAFAFPVVVGQEVEAVLEFFSTRSEAPSQAFWDITGPIGNQLGQVIQRKRAEEKLRSLAQKLERSNRELKDFAFIASHDLQEPLRKIQAFGDRLHSCCRDVLKEQGRDYLERILKAAGRMQLLISDLLAFSRVESAAQPFAPCDLGRVVKEVINDLEASIEQTSARIEATGLPVLEADATQMRQLFQNLLSNALKFQKEGASPQIQITGKMVEPANMEPNPSTGEEYCLITVQDNGIGFDEKYSDRIFNLFERLHGRDQYEGTGMGLATCRRIVERHGGSITGSSVPGEGSTFSVTLPLRQGRRMKLHE